MHLIIFWVSLLSPGTATSIKKVVAIVLVTRYPSYFLYDHHRDFNQLIIIIIIVAVVAVVICTMANKFAILCI